MQVKSENNDRSDDINKLLNLLFLAHKIRDNINSLVNHTCTFLHIDSRVNTGLRIPLLSLRSHQVEFRSRNIPRRSTVAQEES